MGTGLSFKIIDGAVELQWATRTESDTKGFLVKRRKAKTNDYEVIASHEDWGPLQSQGKRGGEAGCTASRRRTAWGTRPTSASASWRWSRRTSRGRRADRPDERVLRQIASKGAERDCDVYPC